MSLYRGRDGVTQEHTERQMMRSTAVYGLSSILSQAAIVIVAPIYTRALGTEGFGILELAVVTLHLGSIVLLGGLDTAIVRGYTSANDDADRRAQASSGLAFVVVAAGVAALTVALLGPQIVDRWLTSVPDSLVVAFGASLFAVVVSRYVRELLRAQERPRAYLVNATVATFTQAIMGVYLAVVLNLDVTGVLIAYTAAGVLAIGLGVRSSRSLLTLELSWGRLKSLLSFGLPLVWSGLAGWSLMFLDRVLLQALEGAEQVGVYALAYRIAAGVTLIIYAFNQAWTPSFLSVVSLDHDQGVRMQQKFLPRFLFVVAWTCVVIVALSRPAVLLLGGSMFTDAIGLIPILVVGIALLAPIPVIQSTLFVHNRTAPIAYATIVAAAANVALNLLLIPPFGLFGAAWATVFAFGIQLAMYWLAANRVTPVRYDNRRLSTIFLTTIATISLAANIPEDGWLVWFGPPLAIVGYPIAIRLLGGIDFGEMRQALRLIVVRGEGRE